VVRITFVDTVGVQGWSHILKEPTVCPTLAEDIPLQRPSASRLFAHRNVSRCVYLQGSYYGLKIAVVIT
jgi:hypothetical protein